MSSSAGQVAAPGETRRSAYGYAATWMVTREAKTDCRGSGLVQETLCELAERDGWVFSGRVALALCELGL